MLNDGGVSLTWIYYVLTKIDFYVKIPIFFFKCSNKKI